MECIRFRERTASAADYPCRPGRHDMHVHLIRSSDNLSGVITPPPNVKPSPGSEKMAAGLQTIRRGIYVRVPSSHAHASSLGPPISYNREARGRAVLHDGPATDAAGIKLCRCTGMRGAGFCTAGCLFLWCKLVGAVIPTFHPVDGLKGPHPGHFLKTPMSSTVRETPWPRVSARCYPFSPMFTTLYTSPSRTTLHCWQ